MARMRNVLFVALLLLAFALPPRAGGEPFHAEWRGGDRTWVGPEYFAIRWQDWSVREGRLSVESRPGRSCLVMTRAVEVGNGALTLSAFGSARADPLKISGDLRRLM